MPGVDPLGSDFWEVDWWPQQSPYICQEPSDRLSDSILAALCCVTLNLLGPGRWKLIRTAQTWPSCSRPLGAWTRPPPRLWPQPFLANHRSRTQVAFQKQRFSHPSYVATHYILLHDSDLPQSCFQILSHFSSLYIQTYLLKSWDTTQACYWSL